MQVTHTCHCETFARMLRWLMQVTHTCHCETFASKMIGLKGWYFGKGRGNLKSGKLREHCGIYPVVKFRDVPII